MRVSRWLAVLGCSVLFAISAQAQTVCKFTGGAGDTKYTEYGSGLDPAEGLQNNGPAGADLNYYRLTVSGHGSTLNMIAFDRTAPGPTSHVVGDFDFRIGGTMGSHADGMGVALLPVSVYGATGNGPGIYEEGSNQFDGALGFGLDTFNNGGGDVGNPALPNGNDASEISLNVNNVGPPRSSFTYALDMYSLNIGGLTNAYNLHNDNLDDTLSLFDHCHFTVDIAPGGGATVTIQITSNQSPATSPNPLANPTPTLPQGTVFTAISATVPGVFPYEMRIGFGGRTGGANDTQDVANVSVTFSP